MTKTKPVMIKGMPIDVWWGTKALAAKEESTTQDFVIEILRWAIEQDKKNQDKKN